MLWRDERVAWWYRQNVIVFASGVGLLDNPGPAAEPLALVHPLQIEAVLTRPTAAPPCPPPPADLAPEGPLSLRALLRQLPAATARAAGRRLARAQQFVRARLRSARRAARPD
jgi:hypothetical protein